MALDPNIPLQGKMPDTMQQAGSMLALARGALDYRTAQATQDAEIARQRAASEITQTQAQAAQYHLTQEQVNDLSNDFNAMMQDPVITAAAQEKDPEKQKKNSDYMIDRLRTHLQFAKAKGIPDSVISQTMAPYLVTAMTNPAGMQQLMAQRQQAGIGAAGQVAQTQVPAAAQYQPAGVTVGGAPATLVKGQFGQTALQVTPTVQGKGTLQMAPAMGQPEAVSGFQSPIMADWKATQEGAGTASARIGFARNIKDLAGKAITGVAVDRRRFVNGLAAMLGMDSAQVEQTNTDLLAKNSAMLSLTGGNTDAARALAETANPNIHMSPQAIKKASNLVIGTFNMQLAKQQYLGDAASRMTTAGDMGKTYQSRLAQWNLISDPRIFEVGELSQTEFQDMMKEMSPSERKDFMAKFQQAKKMGVIK